MSLSNPVDCHKCGCRSPMTDDWNGFCNDYCKTSYYEDEDEKERIITLEKKVALLEKKLEKCLNKLDISDSSETSNES